ncbi:MAG: hypothetical protein Q6363_001275, partial [Candidatus Njordarchaeota archaeon]
RNILIEEFSIKPMLLGIWHLAVVPLLIYSIFYIGLNIEWFAVYIVEDTICIGGVCFPKLLLSLLTTYIGSYAILTINIYRESNNVVSRVKYMREHQTASEVIMNEKKYHLEKLTDSMRNKFLIFLIAIGVAIITTTKLLQYYAVGIVVVVPIFVIFIVPYITAKMFKLKKNKEI